MLLGYVYYNRKNERHISECVSEGVKNVIVIIYNLYDLVCWKIFYIWCKSILGNLKAALYSCIFPGDFESISFKMYNVYLNFGFGYVF